MSVMVRLLVILSVNSRSWCSSSSCKLSYCVRRMFSCSCVWLRVLRLVSLLQVLVLIQVLVLGVSMVVCRIR